MENSEITMTLAMGHAIYAGIVEGNKVRVLHVTFYPEKPTEEDILSLFVELTSDPEFGLEDVDFELFEATKEEIEIFKSTFTTKPEDFIVKVIDAPNTTTVH